VVENATTLDYAKLAFNARIAAATFAVLREARVNRTGGST
jgi:hypothetical protein